MAAYSSKYLKSKNKDFEMKNYLALLLILFLPVFKANAETRFFKFEALVESAGDKVNYDSVRIISEKYGIDTVTSYSSLLLDVDTGIESNPEDENLKVYSHDCNLIIESAAKCDATISDISGRIIIMKSVAGSESISLDNFPAGSYFLNINSVMGKRAALINLTANGIMLSNMTASSPSPLFSLNDDNPQDYMFISYKKNYENDTLYNGDIKFGKLTFNLNYVNGLVYPIKSINYELYLPKALHYHVTSIKGVEKSLTKFDSFSTWGVFKRLNLYKGYNHHELANGNRFLWINEHSMSDPDYWCSLTFDTLNKVISDFYVKKKISNLEWTNDIVLNFKNVSYEDKGFYFYVYLEGDEFIKSIYKIEESNVEHLYSDGGTVNFGIRYTKEYDPGTLTIKLYKDL